MYRRKLLWIKFKNKITKIKRINIAWIIFGITILLLMSIILPGLFQRYAYYSVLANHLGLPYELKLYGKLASDEELTDYSSYTIYVGGYNKRVEKDGSFEIDFLSESRDKIMVVVMDDKNNVYFYYEVSLEEEEKKCLNIRIRGRSNDVSRDYYFGNRYDGVL